MTTLNAAIVLAKAAVAAGEIQRYHVSDGGLDIGSVNGGCCQWFPGPAYCPEEALD